MPCVFDGKISIEKHAEVTGTELKAQIEKVFATKELRAALKYMVEMHSEESSAFPCWMEGIIIERIRNAGVDLKKYDRWYGYVAAYALLPKMKEIINHQRKYGNPPGFSEFDNDEITEKWLKLIGQSAGITYNELREEFKNIT